jgi:hypothetical protein
LEPPLLPPLAGQGFRLSRQVTLWLLAVAVVGQQMAEAVVLVGLQQAQHL